MWPCEESPVTPDTNLGSTNKVTPTPSVSVHGSSVALLGGRATRAPDVMNRRLRHRRFGHNRKGRQRGLRSRTRGREETQLR